MLAADGIATTPGSTLSRVAVECVGRSPPTHLGLGPACYLITRCPDKLGHTLEKTVNRTSVSIVLASLGLGLTACTGSPARQVNYLDGYPAMADQGVINMVVEIPAGTNDKWEVEKSNGSLQWEHQDGAPRVVQYLAYPANYGMIPQTVLPSELGGDGDPLDVILLGPRVDRGTVVHARPIGILLLLDDGERDDKILAVQTSGPLSDVVDLEGLESNYPGVQGIIEIWFTSYKGPGRLTSTGFEDAAAAMATVAEASRFYQHSLTTD